MSLGEALITLGIIGALLVLIRVIGWIAKKRMAGQVAEMIGQLIPVLLIGVAAVGALLIIDPDQGDILLTSTIKSVPKVIVALVVVILARGIGRIAGVFVEQALRRVSPIAASRARMLVSGIILGVGLIIALQQIGISTDIILILVAALAFGTALAVALAVGLGSVPLARRVAAGRHVANRFSEGQMIKVGSVEGRLASIGLASCRVEAMDGGFVEVPNDEFLEGPVVVQ